MAHSILAVTRAVSLALRLLCLTLLALSSLAYAQDSGRSKVFDHAATGFDLTGAHQFVACESCHVEGQFAGTPTRCEGCHQINGRFNALGKPVDHILSSDQCDFCHNPTLWEDITHVDHTQVFGECFQCHNGVQATGKPADHIPTHNRCVECHSDMAFVPAFFSHDGIDSGCAVCHNGVSATGRGPNHIPISEQTCESCHTSTLAWAPVPRVDHSLVIGACVSCHDNVTATGKPANHIRASEDCGACHSVFTFNDPEVDHSQIPAVEACIDCHNGVIAPGKIPGHIPASNNCGACHPTGGSWQPVNIDSNELMLAAAKSCSSSNATVGAGAGLGFGAPAIDLARCQAEPAWPRTRNISFYVGEF